MADTSSPTPPTSALPAVPTPLTSTQLIALVLVVSALDYGHEITVKIGRFVFYQVWSGVLVGLATWACFAALGMHYAGLWGLAAGVLNCVPYLGPTAVMVASAAAALVQFQSVSTAMAVAAVSLVVTAIEGFALAPLMLGRAAQVNTVATFVAMMFWGWLWGAIGLVVAVPLLMIVKTIADHVESLAPWSELLGERSPAVVRTVVTSGTPDAPSRTGVPEVV